MPVLEASTYRPPVVFRNPHLHTICPSLFRNVADVPFTRERIDTPDGDFLDLDWSCMGSNKIILAIHGLEGSSRSRYIPGIIHAFRQRGWDGVAYNLRGCSGEPNRLLRFYHSGDTADLQTVVQHILAQQRYTAMVIVGFSLGGNLTLKYVGEYAATLAPELIGAAAISVPCDLASCARKLSERTNWLYLKNFLYAFHRKIRGKMQRWPGEISDKNFHSIKTLRDYDDRYTAPLHGFANAEEYWRLCSSRSFISKIRIPTFMINALDDPFLGKESYPFPEAEASPYVFLETPKNGGHVGFSAGGLSGEFWHETRVTDFLLKHARDANAGQA